MWPGLALVVPGSWNGKEYIPLSTHYLPVRIYMYIYIIYICCTQPHAHDSCPSRWSCRHFQSTGPVAWGYPPSDWPVFTTCQGWAPDEMSVTAHNDGQSTFTVGRWRRGWWEVVPGHGAAIWCDVAVLSCLIVVSTAALLLFRTGQHFHPRYLTSSTEARHGDHRGPGTGGAGPPL